eukprot:TRINITY_DN1655_c5_g1_i1.p1 TRINITY_DN1655_c5_g1~~TRINITY_DN1655_c5_g1_i1.p1  ORF type:complete len:380 (+),score=79.75 TRINITY_DN1655_c5_g1_i1:132-1271(+)
MLAAQEIQAIFASSEQLKGMGNRFRRNSIGGEQGETRAASTGVRAVTSVFGMPGNSGNKGMNRSESWATYRSDSVGSIKSMTTTETGWGESEDEAGRLAGLLLDEEDEDADGHYEVSDADDSDFYEHTTMGGELYVHSENEEDEKGKNNGEVGAGAGAGGEGGGGGVGSIDAALAGLRKSAQERKRRKPRRRRHRGNGQQDHYHQHHHHYQYPWGGQQGNQEGSSSTTRILSSSSSSMSLTSIWSTTSDSSVTIPESMLRGRRGSSGASSLLSAVSAADFENTTASTLLAHLSEDMSDGEGLFYQSHQDEVALERLEQQLHDEQWNRWVNNVVGTQVTRANNPIVQDSEFARMQPNQRGIDLGMFSVNPRSSPPLPRSK